MLFVNIALAADIDVTATGAVGESNGAIIFAVHDNETVTGTGNFDPFYRVFPSNADDGRQRGYNTDGAVEFGTGNSFHECLDPDLVPIVSIRVIAGWSACTPTRKA